MVFCLSKDNSTGHGEREREENIDRRRGGKTIIMRGQGWILLAQLGQLKTGAGGKELF